MLKLVIFIAVVACSIGSMHSFVLGGADNNPLELLNMNPRGLLGMAFPVIPSLTRDDIANLKPGPGGTVNGSYMSSSMKTQNVNGEVQSKSETEIIKNDNGDVKEYKTSS